MKMESLIFNTFNRNEKDILCKVSKIKKIGETLVIFENVCYHVNGYMKEEFGMASIQDVAKEAGVSVATVSRVINGNCKVRPETERAVRQAMEYFHYHPNFSARNLRRMETKTVLVLMSTIVNPFLAKIVKAIEDVGMQQGYHTMICTTYDDAAREEVYMDLLRKHFADGAILIGTRLKATELRKLRQQVPLVQCSEFIPNLMIPYVTIDNRRAGYDATKHLIQLGCRRIVHITVDNGSSSSQLRMEGYRMALEEAGISFDPRLIVNGNYGYRNALSLMRSFLQAQIPFDGVFANSDRMAAGAIHSVEEAGLKVPEDVAVVGFDNTDVGYLVKPHITSVSQSGKEMGEAAAQILWKMIEGKEVCEQIILRHELMIRESTRKNMI